jgi:hypothetical protein
MAETNTTNTATDAAKNAVAPALPSGSAGGAALGSFSDPKAVAERAANQALGKQSGTDPCANGGQGNGQATSRGNGPRSGVYNGIKGPVSGLQGSLDKWNAAHADTGLKAYAFSGVGSRSVGSSKHPSGNAVDVVIVDKNGCALNNLYNGDTPSFRAYESLASQVCQDSGGAIGWGGNFGGDYYHDTMHFQNGGPVGQRGRVCEGKANPYTPNNSDPGNTRYDGPTTCQEANGGTGESRGSAGGGGGGGCGEGSGGGCKPISSGAAAAASSMSQGQGLGVNGAMGAALGAFGAMGANPMAAAQGLMQQALGAAAGPIGSMLSGGLANPLTQITSQISGLVQGIGGGILPSLTGVIPAALQGGNLTGLMTDVIKNQATSLIGQNMPNLGGFGQVFNGAMGAAASGADLKGALTGSVSQVFGNAANGPLGSASLSAAAAVTNTQLPGFDISSKLTALGITNESSQEGIADNLVFVEVKLQNSVENKKDFTLPFKEALEELINKPTFDGFTSMYHDYNSMITQGFGNLSNDLNALAIDLISLGKLGDLTDLLNIGTPGQLIRQIIEHGHGITSGLTSKLVEHKLTLAELQRDENHDLLIEILTDINDEEVINQIKTAFEINPSVNIKTLADLLDPEIIFSNSYEYNKFENLRDIALTLSICGGTGRLKTLRELGFIIASLETVEDYEELAQESQPIRIDEYVQLSYDMPSNSWFSSEGPTVADFIGSMAGYVHNDTLPKIDALLQELYDDSVTDDLYELMGLLTDTLTAPTIVNVLGIDYVRVPAVSVYTFGDYLTLDDAVSDIVDAIEYDLDFIKTLSNADPDLENKLYELEALHTMSAEFLAHEQKMRGKYGIEFGDPNRTTHYRGDGVTTNFPLYSTVASGLQVSLSGVQQAEGLNYTYNSTTNQLVFDTPPSVGTLITAKYQVDSVKVESKIVDIWQLANSLESLALDTGHGRPADFLSRLVTNDYHGQRIDAIMKQSRNVQRLSNYGMAPPAYGYVLTDGSDANKSVNFIDHTGIWTPNPTRAGEIWVQNATDKMYNAYVLDRIKNQQTTIQSDVDILIQNIIRQMIFYVDGNLIMSDALAEVYNNNQNNEIYVRSVDELAIGYAYELPTDGYIIGPYKEIVSAIISKENLTNDVFNQKLSNSTEEYLDSIGVRLDLVVTILQRILTASASFHLGMMEGDFQDIFGVQSVSKALLQNIANNY